MMAEDWYQRLFIREAKPVLTPARKSDSQWVISVTQKCQRSQSGRASFGLFHMKRWKLSQSTQLGQRGFAFIINKNHEFVYHPLNTQFIVRSSEMEP